MKSKRIALIVATLPFVTLYCALMGLAIEAHAADKVRLGFSALSLANSPAWIAEEKGIFRKYDIEPELIVVGGGATRAVSAVMAGDLQFGTTGGAQQSAPRSEAPTWLWLRLGTIKASSA
jgi:ABC-type nitrate/sulfonate/bicarbonate transport system substrate-binding protein